MCENSNMSTSTSFDTQTANSEQIIDISNQFSLNEELIWNKQTEHRVNINFDLELEKKINEEEIKIGFSNPKS